MPIKIDIKGDMKRASRFLGHQKKQIPFAASVAINRSAVKIQKLEKRKIVRDLDNPTPQTIKSIRVKRSSKRDLEAAVFILPAIARFLRYQIDGGTRPPRGRVEAVPVNARLNRYGNIPGRRQGKIAKLIQRPDTFIGTIRGITGVWQRGRGKSANKTVTLLIAFYRKTTYQKRFRFFKYAEDALSRIWAREFRRAVDSALRSAR
jgi:hypothetical protein